MAKNDFTAGKTTEILKAMPRSALDAAKTSGGAMVESAGHIAGKMAERVKTVAGHAIQPLRGATEKALNRSAPRVLNPHYAHRKDNYDYNDLISCGNGKLFGAGNPQLPLPNMLMFDRITHVDENGGVGKGEIIAELDIKKNLWFFDCHFKGDPVMPGCLGLDALWQLLGFYLGWMGGIGKGRALGLSELKFTGEVLPTAKLVRYRIAIKRLVLNRLIMGVADGELSVDGKVVYEAKDLKVGLFTAKA